MYSVWYSAQILGSGQEIRSYFIVEPEDDFDPRRHRSYGYAAGPFETKEEAWAWLDAHNNQVVELFCCSHGCTMKQWEYDRWNGRCAYEGQ